MHLKDHIPLQQVRCGLQDPLSNMHEGVHWPDRRTLEHRVKEHRRALVSEQSGLSAVAEHAMEEMHDID